MEERELNSSVPQRARRPGTSRHLYDIKRLRERDVARTNRIKESGGWRGWRVSRDRKVDRVSRLQLTRFVHANVSQDNITMKNTTGNMPDSRRVAR